MSHSALLCKLNSDFWDCYRMAGMRPLHGSIFEDTACSIRPEAQIAKPLPSSLQTAVPAHTEAAQQLAAAHTPSDNFVIELSDSSSQPVDCNEHMSCSSSRPSHAAEQKMLGRPPSTRVARTPKRFLDGIPLASDSISERYVMLTGPKVSGAWHLSTPIPGR